MPLVSNSIFFVILRRSLSVKLPFWIIISAPMIWNQRTIAEYNRNILDYHRQFLQKWNAAAMEYLFQSVNPIDEYITTT